jgi:hypothetical protein
MRAVVPALFLLVVCLRADTPLDVVMQEGRFAVRGWTPGTMPPDGWASVLSVYTSASEAPPLLGVYTVENGTLLFKPRFPLAPGVNTRAVLRLPDGRMLEREFRVPAAKAASATRIENVYPSADLIPENQLKFYIHFSAPVRKGEAWQRIRLLQADGKPVELPFLELDEELWDREQRRLTVLFDPGRIKRGVLPLEEIGSALTDGGRYTLVIDGAWPDAKGAPLKEEFRKEFRVVSAEREPIDPTKWKVHAPAPGTRDPLAIEFPKPLDHALAARSIRISGPQDVIAGAVAIDRNEQRWRFTPERPWAAGAYRLLIDATLEDLAGNKVGRPFDVDIFDPVTARVMPEVVELPFTVRAQ